jgi:deazaflavin-dependent oxidoreductase (nitroreductase family)
MRLARLMEKSAYLGCAFIHGCSLASPAAGGRPKRESESSVSPLWSTALPGARQPNPRHAIDPDRGIAALAAPIPTSEDAAGDVAVARWNNARMPDHYQRPGWFTTNVFNRVVAALTRLGVSVYGSRVLEVKGRTSGEWRQTPVNLLRYEDAEYLVAPRGHTQWVKNLRASGQGRLRVGRRAQPFHSVELPDDEKPPLLRAYLKRWKFEVGMLFAGVGPDSSDEELRRIAPDHPVFRVTGT